MSEPNGGSGIGSTAGVVPDDPNAIVDLLGEDEVEIKDDTKDTKKDKEEILDLDEDDKDKKKVSKAEGESEDEPEEELDITGPPRKKQLLKDFPDLFKKHPWFEKMIYRDREIAEQFGGMDGIRESIDKANTLDEMEGSLLQGSTVELFSKIKENDPAAFGKITKNLLTNLQKVDKAAYVDIVTDNLKRVLFQAHDQGTKAKNDDLISAVETLVGWAFPGGIAKPSEEVDTKVDTELEQERNAFRQERLESAVGEVQSRIDNILKATVEQYIDPKGDMSSFSKKKAVEEVCKLVDRDLAKNITFRKEIQKLWDDAERGKLAQIHKDKIKSKYITSAKGLLKKYIMEVRKEVLKDSRSSQRSNGEDKEETSTLSERRTIPAGRSTPRQSGKNEMKKGETALEFLSRD